ncbi:hypothetical protein BD311DRAFT_727866 [Dichomitus squalens]|uniref:Protein kinase domain-containing protein n=1 Tax=Dichomitus squalens TaxID=114155 RepID=A0A4V2JZK3_9APHY|nr:hypothetical protein BD311DRAFT_727866 [Dichomitus squalens]
MQATLCELMHNKSSLVPTARDTQCFETLRAAACGNFEDEAGRQIAFTEVLIEGGILPEGVRPGFVISTDYHDDGDLRAMCLGHEVFYYIQVIKNEVCATKSEPYFETICCWLEQIRYIMSTSELDVDDNGDKDDRAGKVRDLDKVNFPVVLVMHFGPFLVVAAAVYGSEPSAEVVGCIPLHVHDINLAELEAGDRLLAALRVAVHSLRERYPDIANSRRSLAHFPFREFYVNDRGVRHEFTYLTAIDEKRVFRVETLDTETSRLVVKFSRQYSEAAHRAAHALGLAPVLHAVNKVYDWYMIVMEDMPAGYTTMWDLKRESSSAAMSLEDAQDTIKTKLAELHRRGFVHGDVRDKSTAAIARDVLLVDWDWAGVKAEARYPRNVNQEIARPKGATSGELITEEHDMWMAGRLIQRV